MDVEPLYHSHRYESPYPTFPLQVLSDDIMRRRMNSGLLIFSSARLIFGQLVSYMNFQFILG